MADIVLSKEGFGLKLYNKFPPRYQEDDVGTNYALRRYLEAIAEGGFSYSIDEWNGILNFADPDQATPQALPILFKQFGLEVFNGIPEAFLRYLLPRMGTAWSKKGGLDVIEFVASSISGVKTSTVAHPLPNGEVDIDVRLEMDFSLGDYFPDPKQLARILTQFLPFYLGLRIIYVYVYHDHINIIAKDERDDHVVYTLDDKGFISSNGYAEIPVIFPSDKDLNDDFILNGREQLYPVPDEFFDKISNRVHEIGSLNSCWSPFELKGGYAGTLPLGFRYLGSLNMPEFQENKNLFLNKVYVEVDQHFDVIKQTPMLDTIDFTEVTDSRKDHVEIFPITSPTLNTGLVLNEDFTTNSDGFEWGSFSLDACAFDKQTITTHESGVIDSTRSCRLPKESLNTHKEVLNHTFETNNSEDTDSYDDCVMERLNENTEFSVEEVEHEKVTTGSVVCLLPMLNTGNLTLNSGFETNVSNVEDSGVQVTDEVSSAQVSSKVSEIAVFVAPVLGMLTNTMSRVMNDSGFDIPEGYDIIRCRSGTETIFF